MKPTPPLPRSPAPSLSVVVPVRDGAATLPECLTAMKAALPDGAELVVVDDGSIDDSGNIARQHGAKVVHHEHSRGTSAARNAGWRAARGDRIAFVDADVVLDPAALHSMMASLDSADDLLGVNGLYALGPLPPGAVTAFTNTSIVYQHQRHGDRVSSAFTGMCLLRRSALEGMGGWDERWGARYADDVITRYLLPPRCIALDRGARGRHLKRVPFAGLMRHRANIGWHYLRSLRCYWSAVRKRPQASVLNLRYPANTALALVWIGLGLGATVLSLTAAVLPSALLLVLLLTGAASLAVNAGFIAFTARHRGVGEALLALPISVLEGSAFLLGISASALSLVFERAPATATEPA